MTPVVERALTARSTCVGCSDRIGRGVYRARDPASKRWYHLACAMKELAWSDEMCREVKSGLFARTPELCDAPPPCPVCAYGGQCSELATRENQRSGATYFACPSCKYTASVAMRAHLECGCGKGIRVVCWSKTSSMHFVGCSNYPACTLAEFVQDPVQYLQERHAQGGDGWLDARVAGPVDFREGGMQVNPYTWRFADSDGILRALLALVRQEETLIIGHVAWLSLDTVIDALADARDRGVSVKLTVNYERRGSHRHRRKYERIKPNVLYNGTVEQAAVRQIRVDGGRAHTKAVYFASQQLEWLGSFNATESGMRSMDAVVVTRYEDAAAAQHLMEWVRLHDQRAADIV